MFRFFWLISSVIFLPLLAVAQQMNEPCSNKISYEDHNQIDYEIILSNDIEGTVVDSNGNLLADACFALFTKKGHRFIAQTITDENAHFKFGKIPKGSYRLIGKSYPFCTANAIIRIVRKKYRESSTKQLVLHLQDTGTDSCSYFEIK